MLNQLNTSSKAAMQQMKRQTGLTIVELLVAISLGIFLSWGAVQAFLSGKQTYTLQQTLSRIQENARTAQELIGYDVRDSGNYGCAVGKFVANPTTANMLTGTVNHAVGAGGWYNPMAERNFAFAVFAVQNVSGAATADTTLLAPLSPPPIAGTDVLIVHNATYLGADVLSVPAPSATQVTVPSRGFAATDILSISDCASNYIFQPTAVSSGGGNTTLTFSPLPVVPLAGSSVMQLRTTIYYIGNNAAGVPSLYRRVSTSVANPSDELLSGVENMKLQVGIDTNNDGVVDTFQVPSLVTPAQWSAWDDINGDGDILEASKAVSARVEQNVVAIRYSLLLRSDTPLLTSPQPYNFNGVTTTPTDLRLRQVVTNTIGIRSRVN